MTVAPTDPAHFALFFLGASKSKKGGSCVEANLSRASIDRIGLRFALQVPLIAVRAQAVTRD